MTFLRNVWYVAMWSENLRQESMEHRVLLEEPVVFFRNEEGQPVALFDRCPHRLVPLHMGKLCAGGRIECGYHGLQFDQTGQCVHNPHRSGRIPSQAKVKSYPLVEKHSLIWIWMGDKPADKSLIPDFHVLDAGSPLPVSKRDCIKMEVGFGLIINNLLDLSHAAFLHKGILGNEHTAAAEIGVEERGDTIYVRRENKNVPPPTLFDMLFQRNGASVDLWNEIRCDAPGNFLNDVSVRSPNAPRESGTGIFGTHFLTPETRTSTYYHFAAARQNPLPFPSGQEAQIQQTLAELRRYAFEQQDEPMMLAQQREIQRAGGEEAVKPMLLEIDAGPVRYQRVFERLKARDCAN
ncbi:aromatic ring-hydroxylating dioxygenase subunit alpha [Ottowia thiooxydans]|uniref:Phenylpropionate dioxygenase-like ring-hydroxylating dioxygenase large terminal subunit n=1 Tax=Ottowia thiooxydans TaxID=219182 RepID=A0ABV2Q4H3_9BURK